eukprot:10574585-Alexandrium_andersonii.AAC.1
MELAPEPRHVVNDCLALLFHNPELGTQTPNDTRAPERLRRPVHSPRHSLEEASDGDQPLQGVGRPRGEALILFPLRLRVGEELNG